MESVPCNFGVVPARIRSWPACYLLRYLRMRDTIAHLVRFGHLFDRTKEEVTP